MEKVILTPKPLEIVVNSGSVEGAVDLFSYSPDIEPAARSLGSLFIVGWRQADTNTMGYMASLIAALARREYYAQPNGAPRDAFIRTLRKINEVADEFFKSSDVSLSVGVFAIAGNTLMASKLDKFKILLAREDEVIDVFNNVMLFSKEHIEKRRFSNIISGSLQSGDRILAYHPAKQVVARERYFKPWFLKESADTFASKLQQTGADKPEFGASFVHINIDQTTAPAQEPTPIPEQSPVQPTPTTPETRQEQALKPIMASWRPRQQAGSLASTTTERPEQEEAPNIIPTEFALGTRQRAWSRWADRLRVMRLDGRGKAAVLVVAMLAIVGITALARSLWFTSPEEERMAKALNELRSEAQLAESQLTSDPQEARLTLVKAISSLRGQPGLLQDREGRELLASLTAAMDSLDHAEPADASAIIQLNPETDRIVLATWASPSQSLWAVTEARDASHSTIRFDEEGTVVERVALDVTSPDLLVGWRDGVLVIDTETRTVTRVSEGATRDYVVPVQETILDAEEFLDNLYLLTDRSILKVSDLDTNIPVTKQWFEDTSDLAAEAKQLWIDGNIYTMGNDGMLATYFRGAQESIVQSPLQLTGRWTLVSPAADRIAIASPDRMRVYVLSLDDGSIITTKKLDGDQPLVLMAQGPDGSTIAVTEDNRIWQLE